ncbi:hypothetical protein SLA2020_263360 [Shorea laevis]
MSLLSWNCRGLGNPRIVHNLCQMVKEKRPRFLFLMETKIRQKRMHLIRNKIGFDGMVAVDSIGLSGGLALLWQEANEVSIQNYSLRHISVVITTIDSVRSWRLTGFYGHPDWASREESWQLLSYLHTFQPHDWLCVGDFNEITDHSEKKGGARRNRRQMEMFRSTLEACQLLDLGFRGPKFTWTNGRGARQFTKERLDRAVATKGWCDLFRDQEVSVLAAQTSDHNPLLVRFSKREAMWVPKRPFKFEEKWNLDDESGALIRSAWADGGPGISSVQRVQHKLQQCQSVLKQWSSSKYGHVGRVLKQKTSRLTLLQKDDHPADWAEIKTL